MSVYRNRSLESSKQPTKPPRKWQFIKLKWNKNIFSMFSWNFISINFQFLFIKLNGIFSGFFMYHYLSVLFHRVYDCLIKEEKHVSFQTILYLGRKEFVNMDLVVWNTLMKSDELYCIFLKSWIIMKKELESVSRDPLKLPVA